MKRKRAIELSGGIYLGLEIYSKEIINLKFEGLDGITHFKNGPVSGP